MPQTVLENRSPTMHMPRMCFLTLYVGIRRTQADINGTSKYSSPSDLTTNMDQKTSGEQRKFTCRSIAVVAQLELVVMVVVVMAGVWLCVRWCQQECSGRLVESVVTVSLVASTSPTTPTITPHTLPPPLAPWLTCFLPVTQHYHVSSTLH